MEGVGIFKKNPINVAHLPTLMLAIGYPLYWAELLRADNYGVTTPSAAVLFFVFAVFVLWREREILCAALRDARRWFLQADTTAQVLCGAVLVSACVMIACSFYASMLAPHLMQESDTMNYHYSLTRQHLILNSFRRIPWSGFDLFLMPVDYALAPYWFVTPLPNKIPQFLFFIGLIAVLISITHALTKDGRAVLLAVGLFLGTHGFGIQMGTAMLDMTNAYLFLAALDSFMKRARWLFILEANFYIWSKSFVPLSILVFMTAVGVTAFIFQRCGFQLYKTFDHSLAAREISEGRTFLGHCAAGFLAVAVLIAGPFVVKSCLYAGTPLYPFAFGIGPHPFIAGDSVAWTSLKAVADYVNVSVWHNYGYGRSLIDWVRHFWLVAVPTAGVNNAFDYPLGLGYLLSLGPFVVFTIESLKHRRLPLLALCVVVMWGLWWFGSQQSRWLYVPLLSMFVVTATKLVPSKILSCALILALAMNAASIVRAHKGDWGKTAHQALRPEDRRLVDVSVSYVGQRRHGLLEREEYEVAFAQFPVVVRKESLPNAIAF